MMWGDGIYYGGISIDEAYTIKELIDGNYIIAGTTRSMGNGGYGAWVIKIDQNGTVIWDQTYGGSLDDKIKVDGNYFIAKILNTILRHFFLIFKK